MLKSKRYARLLRLRKSVLDEKRVQIAAWEKEKETNQLQKTHLGFQRNDAVSQASLTPLSGLTLGAYLERNATEVAHTQRVITRYDVLITQGNDELFPLFQDFKSLELLETETLAYEKKEIADKEQDALDDKAQYRKKAL